MPSSTLNISENTGKMKAPGTASRQKFDAAYEHNLRLNEKGTEHLLHPEFTEFNKELVNLTLDKTYCEIADERVAEMEYYKNHNVRKNAVYMVELVLAYNRDNGQACILDTNQKERARWEETNLKFLREQFKDPVSGKDNLVAASVHYDESSPHIHALIIPEYDGHLNQTPYFSKKRFHELQRDYGELMSKEFGLQKSRQNSRATNRSMKAFHYGLQMRMEGKQYEYTNQFGQILNPREDLKLREGETKDEQYKRIDDYFGMIEAAHYKRDLQQQQKIAELETDLQNPDLAIQRKIDNAMNKANYMEHQLMQVSMENEKTENLVFDIIDVMQQEKDRELMEEKVQILIQQNDHMMQVQREREAEKKKQQDLQKKRKEYREEKEREEKEDKEKTENRKKKKRFLMDER